jgi:hypothetical protein
VRALAETFYLGGYWGGRQESIDKCADRLANFLKSLASVDPLLSSWFSKSNGRSSETTIVNPTLGALQQLLLEGRAHRDADGSVMDNLGFRAGL